MYSRIFNEDYLYRYALLEDNPSFVIFGNNGEGTTLRQEHVSFSSDFMHESFSSDSCQIYVR